MELNPIFLRQRCEPADFQDPAANRRWAQQLVQLMLKQKGIGCAANQAGLDLRLFVMLAHKEILHCFNPEIIEYSTDQQDFFEGCLSFPKQWRPIRRPARIQVRYADAHGKLHERCLADISARCFQHELDHLNGVCFDTRVGPATLDLAKEKRRRRSR